MTTQGLDTAPRSTDVAEEQLKDGCGSDVLGTHRVLCPTHRIAEGAGAVGAGVVREVFAHPQERLLGDAADLLDHLRGVARVVALEDLEHTTRIGERLVPLGNVTDHRSPGTELFGTPGGAEVDLLLLPLIEQLAAVTGRRGHLHALVPP